MTTRYPTTGDYVSLRDAMDRLVNDTVGSNMFRTLWSNEGTSSTKLALPLDVYANDENVVLVAAIPGVDPDALDVSINKNTVTIGGELPNVASSEDAKEANWYLHELPNGSFSRSVTLPVEVDAARADAIFEHGVLRLTLPKAEAARPRRIEVKMGTGNATTAISGETSKSQ